MKQRKKIILIKQRIQAAQDRQKSYADRKVKADGVRIMSLEGIHVDDKLQFVEEPVKIMEREIKRLKRSRIPLVKIEYPLLLKEVDLVCSKVSSYSKLLKSSDTTYCTVNITYANAKTFADDVSINNVGDKELKSYDDVGTGRITKKEKNDNGVSKEPNKEWKLNHVMEDGIGCDFGVCTDA
ncbi:hypothetical protein Tco_0412644 [Tanacetum coccineum]